MGLLPMGRRSLRKVDPSLDLSPWLLESDQLPERLDATELFGRSGPLEIEVGSGKGLFLCRASVAFPDHLFLGIELARKYARFTAARLAKQAAANAKIIHGDAVGLLHRWVPDASTAAVHVYFPDPWWKKRHHKRRVMQEGFVRDIARVLARGGVLHFWTDVQPYYEASVALIQQHTQLAGPFVPPPQPAQHDLDYRTHFERRTRLAEQTVYRAEFRKS